jgi:hypothetical protein
MAKNVFNPWIAISASEIQMDPEDFGQGRE